MQSIGNTGEDIAIGIDLGTTYCALSVYINGKVEIVSDFNQGVKFIPSYVCYPEGKSPIYGAVAKNFAFKYPENTIFDAKRIIGREWDDPKLQDDIKRWPFEVEKIDGILKIKTGKKYRYPQEVSAKLLSTFCRIVERHLQKEIGSIRKAVITVPAYFNEGQRRATIEAGVLAGIEVLSILNEPTAAAIAYRFERRVQEPKTVLIYDLGGGTFDVSIVHVTEEKVEALCVDGDTHLGGEDFDELLVEYCAKEFQNLFGLDVLEDRKKQSGPLTRLKLQCEKTKESLSACGCEILPLIVQCFYDGKDLEVDITREKLEELIKPLVDKTIQIVERAIGNTNTIASKSDIDEIILIGGSTRIPLVQTTLRKYFGKQLINFIHPEEAVAYGAAVHAAMRNDGDMSSAEKSVIGIVDVTPMSIGWENDKSKELAVTIPKNTSIPCRKTSRWITLKDQQTSADIMLYQGEDTIAKKNHFLGSFTLSGLEAKPAGQVKGDIIMEINENGILMVTAKSDSNGASNSLTVEDYRSNMDKDTIDNLITELSI